MKEKLTKAKYEEWLASLLGASGIAFGLGVMSAKYFTGWGPGLVIIGIGLHGWGMYRMHQKNK